MAGFNRCRGWGLCHCVVVAVTRWHYEMGYVWDAYRRGWLYVWKRYVGLAIQENEMTKQERLTSAEKYCFKRSWRLRLFRNHTRHLIRLSMFILPPKPPSCYTRKYWAKHLRDELSVQVRNDCKNPIVIFILLQIVLPIVIKFIIEWWFNRKNT